MAKPAKTDGWEKRLCPFEEIRAEKDGDEMRLQGLVVPWDQEADVGGMFTEVVRRGAFKKTMKELDQVFLVNHDDSFPVARRSRATLRLKETDRGWEFDATLPNSPLGINTFVAAQRGDFGGMSFNFKPVRQKWSLRKEIHFRELIELRSREISIVTFPQYEGTTVEEARSLVEAAEAEEIRNDSESTTQEPGGDLRNEPGQTPTPGEADRTTQEPDAEERKREIAETQIRLNQKRKEA